jgi:hypothetical protein
MIEDSGGTAPVVHIPLRDEVMPKERKVGETREALIMALAWECPFCKKMNGIPEIDVCKCGARRVGAQAIK